MSAANKGSLEKKCETMKEHNVERFVLNWRTLFTSGMQAKNKNNALHSRNRYFFKFICVIFWLILRQISYSGN